MNSIRIGLFGALGFASWLRIWTCFCVRGPIVLRAEDLGMVAGGLRRLDGGRPLNPKPKLV